MAKKKRVSKPNDEYEIKPQKFKPSTKRILSLDPGSKNCGISLIAVNENLKVRVVANSLFTDPVNDLVSFNAARTKFLSEVDRWVTCFDPQGIAIERFQARGLLGPLSEQVTSMIGLLGGKYERLPMKLLTAAVWKNAFHRRFDVELDELYKLTLTTPHQLDSIFIGIYGLEQGMQVELDYDPFDIVKQAEATSAVRLINKRR